MMTTMKKKVRMNVMVHRNRVKEKVMNRVIGFNKEGNGNEFTDDVDGMSNESFPSSSTSSTFSDSSSSYSFESQQLREDIK